MEDMISLAFFDDGNRCASGTTKGQIYIWTGNNCTGVINAH
jgi:hypothetical protein